MLRCRYIFRYSNRFQWKPLPFEFISVGVLCGWKLHMWWGRECNPSRKPLKFTLFKWLAGGLLFMALCVTTTTVTHDLQNQMGGKKRNNKTFTKAPWNVKPLLTLWRCVSICLPQMGNISEKLFIIKDFLRNISTSFCESTADCSLVCSVSREDSSQSLTSCLNLLPSPMDPAGDRLPGKDSSQRYAWVWMHCFYVILSTVEWKWLFGTLTWKIAQRHGGVSRAVLSCKQSQQKFLWALGSWRDMPETQKHSTWCDFGVVGFFFSIHLDKILNKMRPINM